MTKEEMINVAVDEFNRLRRIEEIQEELRICYYDLDCCTDPHTEYSLRQDILYLRECLHRLTSSAS